MDSSQNLLRPDQLTGTANDISVPRSRPPGYVFSIVLDVLSIIAAVGFGWSYRQFLAQQKSLLALLSILLALGVLTSLQAILTTKRKRRLLVLLGEVAAMGIFFYDSDPAFLVAAVVLCFGFLAWGYAGTRREMNYSTEVRFWKHTGLAMGKFVTAALLFMVLLYVPLLTPRTAFVSENTFSGFFNWTAGLVEGWYPGVPLAGSFGNFAQGVVTRELQGNSDFQSLTPAAQSTTISLNVTALMDSFSKNFGTMVHASDTVAGVAYDFIEKALSGWQNRFGSAFWIGWALAAFLLLRSIGILFVWLGQICLAVVYEILSAAGVITIKEQQTTKEVIGYK
jgi:hypothetical protein